MKKLFQFAMMFLALTSFVACGPDEPIEEKKDTFEISVTDIEKKNATISIKCNKPDVYFATNVLPETGVEQYGGTLDDVVATYISYLESYEQYVKSSKYESLAELLMDPANGLLYQGEASYDATTLSPGTKYMAFAFILDPETMEIGEMASVYFTTEASQASDMTIAFSIEGAKVLITPSENDVPYIFSYCSQADLDQAKATIEQWASAELQYLIQNNYTAQFTLTGQKGYDFSTVFEDGMTYYVYAYGYDGDVTTNLFVQKFVYTAPDYVAPRKKMPVFMPWAKFEASGFEY